MPRRIVDLSREIYHMMPVANPHINQVPAFWDRMTHATTKGRSASTSAHTSTRFATTTRAPARHASTRCRSRRS
jgi:hypothetical protein